MVDIPKYKILEKYPMFKSIQTIQDNSWQFHNLSLKNWIEKEKGEYLHIKMSAVHVKLLTDISSGPCSMA